MIHVLEVDENNPYEILKVSHRDRNDISPDILKELDITGFSKIRINNKLSKILLYENSIKQIGYLSTSYQNELVYIKSLMRLLKIYKIENGIS